MCRMGQESFWSWFDVNQSTFQEDSVYVQKRLNFTFEFPATLTFNPLTSNLLFQLLLSSAVSTKFEVSKEFYNFPLSSKSEAQQTDGCTHGWCAILDTAY